MNLIVAVDKNWAIGKENKLLVSIPQDMKFFRETTMGKVVVMGRKTLESFPGGQPLKQRTNIVLTTDKNYSVKDAIVVHTIDELLEELKKYNDEDILKNIDWRCKSSSEDILNSINGISWETAQKQRMNVIQEHIDYLDKLDYYSSLGITNFRIDLFEENEIKIKEILNKMEGFYEFSK